MKKRRRVLKVLQEPGGDELGLRCTSKASTAEEVQAVPGVKACGIPSSPFLLTRLPAAPEQQASCVSF
ncbi:hypothetical protein AAY473_039132 [Plecturocebus cupreus]